MWCASPGGGGAQLDGRARGGVSVVLEDLSDALVGRAAV